MNKPLRMMLAAVAIFASVLMIIALMITSSFKGAPVDASSVLTEDQCQASYLLRSNEGHITVYENAGDKMPIVETTINVEGLRAVDRTMLENGIEAQTYEDVLKLLEDFSS